MQLRSFLVCLLFALLAVGTMANRPSKKAMRNSLVRFGKRAAALPEQGEYVPVDERWAAFLDRAGLVDGEYQY